MDAGVIQDGDGFGVRMKIIMGPTFQDYGELIKLAKEGRKEAGQDGEGVACPLGQQDKHR